MGGILRPLGNPGTLKNENMCMFETLTLAYVRLILKMNVFVFQHIWKTTTTTTTTTTTIIQAAGTFRFFPERGFKTESSSSPNSWGELGLAI